MYFAASSTAPPSGGRRLFEPDKPCDTAELAEMQTADSVGCGAEPVTKTTYTGGSAPSALCDCCSVEVGQSEHKTSLCALVEVASTVQRERKAEALRGPER